MSSRHLQIADAVVTALNIAYAGEFTAVRRAYPLLKRKEAAELHVTVCPATFRGDTATRAKCQYLYGVDVVVQKAMDPEDGAAHGQLLGIVEGVDRLFRLRRLSGCDAAAWVQSETIKGAEAGYALDHLAQDHLFTGILRLTFMVSE